MVTLVACNGSDDLMADAGTVADTATGSDGPIGTIRPPPSTGFATGSKGTVSGSGQVGSTAIVWNCNFQGPLTVASGGGRAVYYTTAASSFADIDCIGDTGWLKITLNGPKVSDFPVAAANSEFAPQQARFQISPVQGASFNVFESDDVMTSGKMMVSSWSSTSYALTGSAQAQWDADGNTGNFSVTLNIQSMDKQ